MWTAALPCPRSGMWVFRLPGHANVREGSGSAGNAPAQGVVERDAMDDCRTARYNGHNVKRACWRASRAAVLPGGVNAHTYDHIRRDRHIRLPAGHVVSQSNRRGGLGFRPEFCCLCRSHIAVDDARRWIHVPHNQRSPAYRCDDMALGADRLDSVLDTWQRGMRWHLVLPCPRVPTEKQGQANGQHRHAGAAGAASDHRGQ